MNIIADDIRSIFSGVALVVSFVSLYFTRVNWLQSNRPIVSAFVTEDHSGNQAAIFSLSLANTGNRPAVHVRLHITDNEIKKLFDPQASENQQKLVAKNFSPEAEVPLLRNGEELKTSFGSSIGAEAGNPCLLYGQSVQIKITYKDMEGRKFSTSQPLRVYARQGFGGGIWG